MISIKPKLFIDDERFPPVDNEEWYIARNIHGVNAYLDEYGFPDFISFDHDLGDDTPTGYEITHHLINLDYDQDFIPETFKWYVHSQNPVGRDAINGLLENYMKVKFDA